MTESLLIPYHAVAMLEAKAVLVLAPHADDEVFGCGGALAIHAAAGCPVSVVVVSDGAHAAADEAERVRCLAMREAESAAAAAILGYAAPQFWRLPDRGVEYGEALIERLLAAITTSGADLVYAPALGEAHPDHRVLALAAVEALRRLAASQPDLRLAMYEIGVPLQPNLLLDITAQVERKAEAMRCFSSQLQVQPYDAHIAALNRYRTYTLPATVLAAEAFHLVAAVDVARDPLQLFASEYRRQQHLGLAVDGGRDLPLVSVIIRSMDRDLLADALDSLALQTYPHLEVLVVNAKGGEHRDLGERCGRFPLRLINGGGERLDRAVAGNAGLAAARGELAAFLDDDDTIDADHYQQLVAAQRAAGGDMVVYAGVRCIDRDDAMRTVFHVFAEDFSPAKLLAGNFIPIHAPLFPRRFFDSGVRFDETLALYEDWDFWLQLARLTNFQRVDRVSATYFSSGSSGVGIQPSNPAAKERAAEQVYTKWLERLTANDLLAIGALYRQSHGDAAQARQSEALAQSRSAVLAEEKAAVESRLSEVQQQLQAVEQQRAELAQALAGSSAELDAVYRSTSWRLSAPIRRLCGYRRPS